MQTPYRPSQPHPQRGQSTTRPVNNNNNNRNSSNRNIRPPT